MASLEGLPGSLSVAVAPWVRPPFIVLLQPGVQVHLQVLQAAVELLAKQEAVAFVLRGLVEPFTDASGLGVDGPGPGVVDVLHRQVELASAVLGLALSIGAVLNAPVGEDVFQPDALLIEKGDHPVVDQVRLRIISLHYKVVQLRLGQPV